MSAKILLVEDDIFLRDGIKEALKKEGYSVFTAEDCKTAKSEFVKESPNLLILDVMLPDGNGFDLCTLFRSLNKNVPILFLTACDDEVQIVRGLDSGGSSFVGEIAPQESATASANLRVDSELIGKTMGTIIITYEDSFGEKFELKKDVETKIEKKVIKAEKQEEKEKKNPLWWLFLLGGLLVGGSLGFGIPFFINSNKQRKKDEERL